MIVEDDKAIRDLVAELLRELGFNTIVGAATADEALSLARGRDLDLVVLDYRLKEGSGIDVAERLRALPGFRAPLLVTTALPRPQAAQVCAEAGACECVPKPFDVIDFLSAVQGCLEDSPAVAV
ncbi:MAG TPA: response regulator [Chloroflexota bacterium]|nr:response regulator [Chloroflexota bacterium]